MADVIDRTLKQHDLWPPLETTLTDDGVSIDLTNAVQVKLLMKTTTTSPVHLVSGIMTIDPDQVVNRGKVSYDWIAGDTDTPDTYQVEFEITWPNAEPQTVPNEGYRTIVIEPDLG